MPRRTYNPRRGRTRSPGPGVDADRLLLDLQRIAQSRRTQFPTYYRQDKTA